MWFDFAVAGVRPGVKKAAHVYLKRSFGGGGGARGASPLEAADSSLAAFCFPLGADQQTPRDRMAPEVRLGRGRGPARRGGAPACPRAAARARACALMQPCTYVRVPAIAVPKGQW
jgi:hypothetical protein